MPTRTNVAYFSESCRSSNHNGFREIRGRRSPGSRTASRLRPSLEMMEDRVVLSTLSSIASNFNGTAIPANDSVWFSSVAKVQGLGSSPVTLRIVGQTISFTLNGIPQSVSVPNTVLTLSPTATSATTSFDAGTNTWKTTAPASLSGNVFLDGVAFQAVGGLPGGIKNVTWAGEFSTDTPGVKVNWQWAAAVYSQFGTGNNSLGVKPVDDSGLSSYQNSDHAGTPEIFKSFVTGGARGGGGSNYTGSYSGTATVTPDVDNLPPPASLTSDVVGSEASALSGVVVTLTGIDSLGNPVSLTTTTDARGFHIFTGLRAGTYGNDRVSGVLPHS